MTPTRRRPSHVHRSQCRCKSPLGVSTRVSLRPPPDMAGRIVRVSPLFMGEARPSSVATSCSLRNRFVASSTLPLGGVSDSRSVG